MSSVDWDLDIPEKTLMQSIQSLFNNSFLSNLHFKFPNGEILYGHSTIIFLRSEKMLEIFGQCCGEIEIQEEYSVFYRILRYMYTDEFDPSGGNLKTTLMMSCKYELQSLERLCFLHYVENFKVETGPEIMEWCLNSGCERLRKNTIDLILRNKFNELICSKYFCNMHPSTLKCILEMDEIAVESEFGIFYAVHEWSKHRCIECESEVETTSKNIRDNMDELLKLIRFPTMSMKEFQKCIDCNNNVLSHEEISSIQLNIIANVKNSFGFNDNRRTFFRMNFDTISMNHLALGSAKSFFTNQLQSGITKFTVNRSIVIKSLYITGSEDIQRCTVEIFESFTNDERKLCFRQEDFEIDSWGGLIVFESYARIYKDRSYEIKIKFKNVGMTYLVHGQTECPRQILEDNVKFTFYNISPILYYVDFKIV